MGLWAEPFTTLRLQKIFNLYQDPFERADITSNTFWDWNLNHVGSVYGVMDEVFAVRRDIQGVPATLVPAELQPGKHHGKHARGASSEDRRLKEGLDVDRIRDRLNQMIDQRFRERSIR